MFGTTDPAGEGGAWSPARRRRTPTTGRRGWALPTARRTSNRFLGDGKTVFRGGWGIGYDVIFYNLLTVATNPNVNTLIQNNILDLYPNKLTGSSTPVFNPLNAWTNMPENLENPESRFYSLTMQRELGKYLFEVGYSGSRGAKGINQIIVNPAVLTPEQAATVRAGGSIPSVQARRVHPAARCRAP